MPELPEAEVARRQLQRWTSDRTVQRVQLLDPAAVRHKLSTRPGDVDPRGAERLRAALVGRRAQRWRRHGKRIGVAFPDASVWCHLGMTGRWVRRPSGEPAPRHARVGWELDDARTVWFVDTRRFGCLVVGARDALEAALRDGHGPDALDEPLDGPGLAAAVGPRARVKTALMDQARLAGLGNIQVVEALHRAGLHPGCRGSDVPAARWAALAEAIPVQLRHTLAFTDGEEVVYVTDGSGDNPFAVYGRSGEACPRCGTTLQGARMGGRATVWCPRCQPAPEGSGDAG